MTAQIAAAPRKRPRQARSKATVDAILEATTRILIDEGYERASTNRIAERAGVSIGSLYQYFPSKQALIATLLDQHIEEMAATLEREITASAGAPLQQAVRAVVQSMIEAHRVHPELHRVFAEQLPGHGAFARMREVEAHIGVVLQAALQARASEVREIKPELASFIIGRSVEALTHGAVIDHPKLLDDDGLIDEITQLVLRYLSK